ncbi:hypothetical protein [Alkalimonas amylolytica]|uniref:Membrane-anchored ribosome-binding protein, inhibits growth in stationary phase, ElaB/YqjD/DUF883 family n=1 Tax=Alkalimonas amylolytica TaxID=152573 RepID=A0A1H4BGF3_ALKAM|nr:hypothetical protein [Alkalimonas amylolytica]SEA47210.1 hypothetical protein SAMN04488051_103348 [Alkalimonas amylolytica]
MNKPTETNSAQSTFDRGVDAASGSVHKAIDSASDASGPAIKKATDTAHSTVDSMTKGAHQASETVSAKSAQLQHLQQQLADSTRAQIRNHPLLSLGIALASGALFAMWLNRHAGEKNAS